MGVLKWAFIGFTILGALLSIIIFSILKDTKPALDGEIKLSGLISPVRVIRDVYAIPHIYAQNSHDLLLAQGYVTSQDRLWQMDFSRRISHGRLSEIFGEKTLEIDLFLRALELTDIAKRFYDALDNDIKSDLGAYAAGVNSYIESGKKPIESMILGYQIEPWSPIDSISIHLLSALDLSINLDEELFAYNAMRLLSEKKSIELFSDYTDRVSNEILLEKRGNYDLEILRGYILAKKRFNMFQGQGASNSWVVDGTKSLSGKPILANDPHLRAQIPSPWYEAHLNAPGINVVGATFPGTPYILIGHNGRIAWGFTDSMADRVDLYVEKINPEDQSKYWYLDHWEDIRVKEVTIGIKSTWNHKALKKEIRYTRHGPIINPYRDGLDVNVAMRWSAREVQDQTLKGLSILNRSKNINDLTEGIKYSGIYTQNLVFADIDGNIGYQLVGGIPIRVKGSGKIPVPGWQRDYEWRGFIPANELPFELNPNSHVIVTANNKIVGDDYPYMISNSWAPNYRHERIVKLLSAKRKLSIDDFKEIQADVYSESAKEFVGNILGLETNDPGTQWVIETLSKWNYEVGAESLPALLYEVIKFNFIRNTFGDELGNIYANFMQNLRFYDDFISRISKDPNLIWWDNEHTPQKETRYDIISKSIMDSMEEIGKKLGGKKDSWTWGAIHKYYFDHPLGRVSFLNFIFNPKSIPAPGDMDTINKSYFSYISPFNVTWAPSYRFIVDLSDVNKAVAMNSTGQSGNPFSEHYSDSIEKWARVNYHRLFFDYKDVKENKWKEQSLIPR